MDTEFARKLLVQISLVNPNATARLKCVIDYSKTPEELKKGILGGKDVEDESTC
jgi:hypothetical protein